MTIVKQDILQGKTRKRPRLFVRKLRANINGRLKEYGQKIDKMESTTKRGKPNSGDFTSAEEKLGGENKRATKACISMHIRQCLTQRNKGQSSELLSMPLNWGVSTCVMVQQIFTTPAWWTC